MQRVGNEQNGGGGTSVSPLYVQPASVVRVANRADIASRLFFFKNKCDLLLKKTSALEAEVSLLRSELTSSASASLQDSRPVAATDAVLHPSPSTSEPRPTDVHVKAVFQGIAQYREASRVFIRQLLRAKKPSRNPLKLSRQRKEVGSSVLFDARYYNETYPDVRKAGMDPLLHYLRFGWRELRDPHALFSTSWYLQANPDVLAAGVNPLLHYIRDGAKEGRKPHPLFDEVWYKFKYSSEFSNGELPFCHYLRKGAFNDYWPNPLIDPIYYRETYGVDFSERPAEILNHVYGDGLMAGLRPSRHFDPRWYTSRYMDYAFSGKTPLEDYALRSLQDKTCRPADEFDYTPPQAIESQVEVSPLAIYYHGIVKY